MPTRSYVDLIFAFGHARLGNADACRQLLETATAALAKIPNRSDDAATIHRLLSTAFRFRIEEAIAGRPHRGPLPAAIREEVLSFPKLGASAGAGAYALDRMRESSRVLEPTEQVSGYRRFLARSALENRLDQLSETLNANQIERDVTELLKGANENPATADERMIILANAVTLSCCVSDEFGRRLLAMIQPVLESLSAKLDFWGSIDGPSLLRQSLQLASGIGEQEWLRRRFLGLFQKLEQRYPINSKNRRTVDAVVGLHIECLIRQRMLAELETALEVATERVCHGMNLAALQAQNEQDWPLTVIALLPIAGGWLRLGRRDRAEQIILVAFELLQSQNERNRCKLPMEPYVSLAVAFLSAVGHDSYDQSLPAIKCLFRVLGRVKDTYTTARYFSRSHLQVAEAAVLAVTAEDRRPFSDAELEARREFLHRLRGIVSERGWDNPKA